MQWCGSRNAKATRRHGRQSLPRVRVQRAQRLSPGRPPVRSFTHIDRRAINALMAAQSRRMGMVRRVVRRGALVLDESLGDWCKGYERMRALSLRWIVLFFAFAMVPLGAMAAYNFHHDPFTMYRRGELYYVAGRFQRKVGAGIIRTEREAEALVIGNSYTANADPDLVERLFGKKTLVMSQWGLASGDIDIVTRYALREIPRLKVVFLSLPIWSVCDDRPHPNSPLPLSLYYGYYWADIEYLLSIETARAAWYKPYQFSEDMGRVYRWWHIYESDIGKAEVLQSAFERLTPIRSRVDPNPQTVEMRAVKTFECYKDRISALSRDFPNVQFYVFNPPHLQWLLHYRWLAGSIDMQIAAMEMIGGYTSSLPNVRFFDFYSAPPENYMHCRNYHDMSHFDLHVTDLLFEAMAAGQFERKPGTNEAATARTVESLRERLDCT